MKRSIKIFFALMIALGICMSGQSASAEQTSNAYAQSAKAFVLMEAQSGAIILSSNENVRLPMASTTKIMTALITLEQPQLDTYFTVDSEAIKVEGSSMGLTQGDQVSLYALAGGMLLSSGNDAANAAAVRISGSVTEFAKLMNDRAAQIGMENTHFVTPSGLHDDDHYSTAYDMALLAKVALENESFRELCSSTKSKLTFGNPPFDRWLSNHNRLLSYYDGCIGVKTGFTKKAGRCLVSAAERDGVTLICVTLDDPNDWVDHANLFDYGFSLVEETTMTPDTSNLTAKVVGGEADQFQISAPKEAVIHTIGEPTDITEEVFLKPFYYAPIQAGDMVGSVRYLSDGKVLAEIPLVAGEDISQKITEVKKSFTDQIKDWFSNLLSGNF